MQKINSITFKSKDGHLFEYRTKKENITFKELLRDAKIRIKEIGYEHFNYIYLKTEKIYIENF